MGRTPVIGFISTWPIYQGTTIDRYAHSLIQGISAAAHEKNCSLLLGCGFSVTGKDLRLPSFWPAPGPEVNFLPVGSGNTDGLIIVPDELTSEQSRYVRDLLASGFPVVFTTPEGPGPVVAVDNTYGIRQAFEHLLQHGHRRIAFIAGNPGQGGDSAERLQAYRRALKDAAFPEQPGLIAFGGHRRDGGKSAMRKILDGGAPFTALIASNDLSCLGAMECLREAGRRIPKDVAVIGFDDILDARSLSPSLTTVRHPAFSLGHQAVITLLERISGATHPAARVIVRPRLILRQSCGCQPAGAGLSLASSDAAAPALSLDDLARAMAEAALIEARNSLFEDLQDRCAALLQAFENSLQLQQPGPILSEIQRVLAWAEERGEDAHILQPGVATLYQHMNTLSALAPEVQPGFVTGLIDRVRLEISDQIQRRSTRSVIQHLETTSQLGLMTAELLTAMNVAESAEILGRHLPKVGIRSLLVALYDGEGDDYTAQGVTLFTAGLPGAADGQRFETRRFPGPGLYPADRPIQLTILPLEVDGQAPGFAAFEADHPELCAAIAHSLSAALRTSRLVRDAVEGRRMAEEASQLKSRFLSMVSHELRTPLSLIVGLSEMVLHEKQRQALSPAILRDMQQIHTNAEHLARLIGDVLDLASSEAGQLHILRVPLDLAEVLQVPARIGEELAREKGLDWEADLPPRGPWIIGDRTRLRQVTLNLLSNAVKFTPAGRVSLRISVVGDEAVVSVSDTGIGIAADEQSTIFDQFYRSRRVIESGPAGLGLGLAISKQLIERHGGHIQVRSPGDLGGGSTFSFGLPVVSAAAPSAEPPASSNAAAGRVALLPDRPQTVLVVDDDPGALAMHTRLLEQSGRRVVSARNGREALELVSTGPPDLILLDLTMPEMDGFAVLDALQTRDSTRDIPVILLTGRPLSVPDLELHKRGVASILGKGLFSAEETLAHVEAALSRRHGLNPATQHLIRKAMAYIHSHYSEPITREEIADHVGISADYLTDCFRQELGITPMSYIRRYRIRQAGELLRESDQSITQIALAVGFSDGAHFTRTFQRELKMTPRAFRRNRQVKT